MSFTEKFAANNSEFIDYIVISWTIQSALRATGNKLMSSANHMIATIAIDVTNQVIELVNETEHLKG